MARRPPSRKRTRHYTPKGMILESIAARVVEKHIDHMFRGYVLTRGDVWQRANGLMTYRIVYRDRDGGLTLSYTIREVARR